MNEFEIVSHTGGKLRILTSQNSVGFHHQSDNAASMFQLGFSLVDHSLRYVPVGGLGTNNMPNGSVPIYMFSDSEGFFGRACPNCNGYFRTDSGGEEYYCPYCSHLDNTLAFNTANQQAYIQIYIQTIVAAIVNKIDVEIDLDEMIAKLPNNNSPFVYSEERQQRHNQCKECKVMYDIIGEFGCCPNCGKLNAFEVFNEKLAHSLKRLNNASIIETDKELQHTEYAEILKNCVSDFEAMAKDIRDELLRIPATPNRKEELKRINFQRINEANEKLSKWFDIDFLNAVSEIDKLFINICFQRRHILTHNSGVVDEKYIRDTNDQTVRLNQRIKIDKDEACKLIHLTRTIAKRLFDSFESIN